MLILEIVVVLTLFVLNGFFAMAELAIISSRRAHLERLAKEGRAGAQIALALADDPARMLAAVQIGFTTTATLAGIFSGATLAERLEELLRVVPVVATYGKPLSIVIVTIGVTYTALVVGELAPKHIALNNPEPIAIRVAQPLAFIARAAAPVIWLLNASTRLLLRLLYLKPRFERALTEEDIHYLVAEGARWGNPQRGARHDRRRSRPCRQPSAHDHDSPAARAMAGPQRSQGANPRPSALLPARPAPGLSRFDR